MKISNKTYCCAIIAAIFLHPAILLAATTSKHTATHKEIQTTRPGSDELNSKLLDCTNLNDDAPYLTLTAKTKNQDNYKRIELGCVTLSETSDTLDETQQHALNDAADYVLQLDNIIRFYIDINAIDKNDKTKNSHLRKQAFAAKKYLEKKGLFAHIEQIRKIQFASETDSKTKKPKTIRAKTSKAKKPPVQPKKHDPSNDYAYHVDKSSVRFTHNKPTLYNNTPPGEFQFIPLESIYFPLNQDNLTQRGKANLNAIAYYILDQSNIHRVIIRGHADNTGSDDYNDRLTDRRSLAVRDYLISQGIAEKLLESMSKGEHQPVDENWTREGRARNRRVELYLVQQTPTPNLANQQDINTQQPEKESAQETPLPRPAEIIDISETAHHEVIDKTTTAKNTMSLIFCRFLNQTPCQNLN